MKRGHESPLEFGDIAVEFVTSRDVLAEITRHRLASFAVQSQRYVLDNKSGDISFIKPAFWTEDLKIAKNWAMTKAWEKAMFDAEAHYSLMVNELGMKPEDARKALPNSTACIICMKANIREWHHIYELRSSPAAYPEMRVLMGLFAQEVQKVFPMGEDE